MSLDEAMFTVFIYFLVIVVSAWANVEDPLSEANDLSLILNVPVV